MKVCPKCNATFEDEVQFCTICGEAIPESQEASTIPPTYMPPEGYCEQKEEQHVSTGKWLLYQLIPIIPVVGWIIYLVMLFVWSFGNNAKNNTFRNWARSNLILVGISLVVWIFIIALLAVFSIQMVNAMGMSSIW